MDGLGGRGRLGERRIERPGRRTGAGLADRAAEEAREPAPEREQRRDDGSPWRRRGRWRPPGRPPARRAGPSVRPPPSSAARCADVMPDRRPGRRERAPPSKAAKTVGRWHGDGRRDEEHARRRRRRIRASGVHRLAAPLDEGRAAREEERHVGAEAAGDLEPAPEVELRAPRLERARRAPPRRRCCRRPARRRPGSASRAGRPAPGPARGGPAGPPRSTQPPPTARRASAIARRTRLSAGGPGSWPSTCSVSASGRGTGDAEPSARSSGTITEWSSW